MTRPSLLIKQTFLAKGNTLAFVAFALLVAACGGSTSTPASTTTITPTITPEPSEPSEPSESPETTEVPEHSESPETTEVPEPSESPEATEVPEYSDSVTLIAHDSFRVSPETWEAFADQTGITVEVLSVGDAGTMVSEAILTSGNPLGDVMFGVDNTFLARALNANLFEPYESPNLSDVPAEFLLDDQHRVTPIDYGDVCVNYWIDALPGDPPTTLEDLTSPRFSGQLVVQHPETSSPGLAFLLATIAGTQDWEQFWADLVVNDVSVTAGWEDAYYGEFVAGGGDRPLVVSYASSPPAEVMFAAEPTDVAPTAVLEDSCFRQIEFAGVLAGSEKQAEAQALIDFMLTTTFQNDVPPNMFVFPVANSATLPEVFETHARLPSDPLFIAPAEIEARRDEWTQRWVEIVLS